MTRTNEKSSGCAQMSNICLLFTIILDITSVILNRKDDDCMHYLLQFPFDGGHIANLRCSLHRRHVAWFCEKKAKTLFKISLCKKLTLHTCTFVGSESRASIFSGGRSCSSWLTRPHNFLFQSRGGTYWLGLLLSNGPQCNLQHIPVYISFAQFSLWKNGAEISFRPETTSLFSHILGPKFSDPEPSSTRGSKLSVYFTPLAKRREVTQINVSIKCSQRKLQGPICCSPVW